MALCGAAFGPTLLAWGLQHTSGTSASLLLALEALFTVLLARLLYGDGRRVWTAMPLLTTGGMVLVAGSGSAGGAQLLGLLAVLAATVAWGVDSTRARPGRARPGAGGGRQGRARGLGHHGAGHDTRRADAHHRCRRGAAGHRYTSYGLSLRLYLLAQRAFGAARTGSVFAFAPFIGAVLAVVLGDRAVSWSTALLLAGVVLHLAESHE
jgi:drug/metabolite transporter (DMT)-like permease